MADFSLPVLTSTYSDMVDTLKARDADLALWLDGTTNTNLPNGAKRWNSTNNNFEKFNGSTWAPLSTKYMINVDYVDDCSVNDSGTSLTDLWTASKITSALLLKVNVSDFTGTNILDKLKLVDGAGSGLDADLIDGMNATSTNTASSVVARDASGNFSANAVTVTNVNGMTGLGSNLPLVAGSASAGTSNAVARQDHVHPLQVNISGNAATATWAASCESANKLIDKNWYWSGRSGQPNWLWGGSDGTNMYVYNPSEFVVANISAPSSGYKHVGVWGIDSIVATGAILVNSAFRAERAYAANYADIANSISSTTAGDAISLLNVGGIGTYAFLRRSINVMIYPGNLIAGSDLTYADQDSGVGGSPAGTWKCMGCINNIGSSVFLRVA